MANGNFGGGDGSAGNPYLIEDIYDLLAMDGYVPPPYQYDLCNWVLLSNIDLGEYIDNQLLLDKNYRWKGINTYIISFNGNGHYIDFGYRETENSLFGKITAFRSNFTVFNLSITGLNINSTIDVDHGASGFCSEISAYDILFYNVNIQGKAYRGTDYLPGYQTIDSVSCDNFIMQQCSIDIELIDKANLFFISNFFIGSANIYVIDCKFKGTGNIHEFGGLIGNFTPDLKKVERCSVEIDLVTDYNYVIMLAPFATANIVKDCYIKGSVVINPVNTVLPIRVWGGFGESSYTSVNVRVNSNYIQNSFINPIKSREGIDHINNYYNYDIYKIIFNDKILYPTETDVAIPKTTSEMKIKDTFKDWDFDNVWSIDTNINEGYPYLKPVSSSKLKIKTLRNVLDINFYIADKGSLRFMSDRGIREIKLVSPNSPDALPIRIMTPKGIMSFSK